MLAELEQQRLADREAETPLSHIKVLLIEDNPTDAQLFQLMLAEAGGDLFEVDWADRVASGLEQLARGGFNAIIVDLSLPDSQGLESFTRLQAYGAQIPIIVLSGLSDTSLAVKAVQEGAQDFLVKGQVNGQLLVRAIRYAIERKRMSERLHRQAADLREKNLQLEADVNMAREIQQIFLPSQYPTFPHWTALENSALKFSHRYISAAAVGGDFFDVFAINDTTAGIFICDVMGHGMRAALITAIMRGLIEELLPLAGDAGKFVTEINRSLRAVLRHTREPFLATALYAVADTAGGELHFVNAGHPSPLRLRREGQSVELLRDYDNRHGPALGLFERSTYPIGHCPIAAGDLIMFFTDGIYEVNNSRGEEFGRDRLMASVSRRLPLPADRLFDEVLDEAQQFAGVREFDDDVCLVGVEVRQIGSDDSLGADI